MSEPKNPCAICGVREATTRDHIPPKAIFSRPLPTSLVTVPACHVCNNGSSVFDERFRVYLGMVVGDKSEKARKLWKERSMATLKKNLRLVRSISEGMQEVELRTSGDLKVGKRIAFLWPANEFQSIVERIARGLYYHHFNEILGAQVRCESGLLYALSDEFMALSRGWAENHIGDGAFSYRFARADEAPLNSLWVFEFYQGLWAVVETSPVAN